MKLVVEEHNGAAIIFTKEGPQPLDDSERYRKIEEALYVNENA